MATISSTPLSLLLLAAILAAAFLVFARVKADYLKLGKLSPPTAFVQTGYFFLYAISSYLFLDSRLSTIKASGWLFLLAIILLVLGFLLVLFSMPFLGRQSFGEQVGRLRTSGLYRYSRNPQLMGGFLFIVGYALLWPSWPGAVWASLWLVVSHLMVNAEEAHLQKIFGDPYQDYCRRTPRYFGLPRP